MFGDGNLGDIDNAIGEALAALREIASDKAQGAEVRVQAATAILDFATDLFSIGHEHDEDEYEDDEFEDEEE